MEEGRAGREDRASDLSSSAHVPSPGRLRPALFALALALALAAGAACGGSPGVEVCGRIPEGGCPVGRGGTCEDRLCRALYDCVGGDWTLTFACGPGTGGSGGAGGEGGEGAGPAGTGTGGEGPCTPFSIDREGETADCQPALQHPDCPAAAAGTCAETACQSGCSDFFVCRAGTWDPVAHCSEEGDLFVD